MRKQQLYQLASECIAFMIGAAPRYPKSMPQTFDEGFVELCGYLDDLLALEKRPISLEGLEKAKDAAMRAKRLFDSGDEDAGRIEIQYALRYLDLAAKGKPAVEPLFQPRNVADQKGKGVSPK